MYDEDVSKSDAELLENLAEILIKSTQDTIQQIDALVERMDETHRLFLAGDNQNKKGQLCKPLDLKV